MAQCMRERNGVTALSQWEAALPGLVRVAKDEGQRSDRASSSGWAPVGGGAAAGLGYG